MSLFPSGFLRNIFFGSHFSVSRCALIQEANDVHLWFFYYYWLTPSLLLLLCPRKERKDIRILSRTNKLVFHGQNQRQLYLRYYMHHLPQ